MEIWGEANFTTMEGGGVEGSERPEAGQPRRILGNPIEKSVEQTRQTSTVSTRYALVCYSERGPALLEGLKHIVYIEYLYWAIRSVRVEMHFSQSGSCPLYP